MPQDEVLEAAKVEGSLIPHIFDAAERFIFNELIDDGMDLAIELTSRLNAKIGRSKLNLAVFKGMETSFYSVKVNIASW